MLSSVFQNAIAQDQSISWSEAVLLSIAALVAALAVTAGLYLVKSALGINITAGPSPLHDLLYHFVVQPIALLAIGLVLGGDRDILRQLREHVHLGADACDLRQMGNVAIGHADAP
jgi:hypothetical protein